MASHSITKEQVLARAKVLPPGIPEDQRNGLVLQELVNETVIAAGLEREGAPKPDEAEVEKSLASMKELAKARGVELDSELSRQGMTLDELKSRIRLGVQFEKRIDRDATDDALKAYFEKHALELEGEVRATQVLVRFRGDDTTTYNQVLKVLGRVKADGSNMADLAREMSDDPNAALDGGDLDFFAYGSPAAPPEVVQACFDLGKRGLVPGPVRSSRGYHIVYVTATRFTSEPSYERDKERVRVRFRAEHARAVIDEWKKAAGIVLSSDAPRMPFSR
ncbi:MAG TPA: peptidylprolyl isomerase [Planctomycetota bacterium]|nr:peptidylprolyl isomerase [Planctomycetota bacterium]